MGFHQVCSNNQRTRTCRTSKDKIVRALFERLADTQVLAQGPIFQTKDEQPTQPRYSINC